MTEKTRFSLLRESAKDIYNANRKLNSIYKKRELAIVRIEKLEANLVLEKLNLAKIGGFGEEEEIKLGLEHLEAERKRLLAIQTEGIGEVKYRLKNTPPT